MISYNLNISFPDINFDTYLNDINPFPNLFKSELKIDSDRLELIIYDIHLHNWHYKFNCWLNTISHSDFGKYIFCFNENINEDVLKIDFSESCLISARTSSTDSFISISLDTIKIFKHIDRYENTATVYLCENGFHFIKYFYSNQWLSNGTFNHKKLYEHSFKGYNCLINPLYIYDNNSNRDSPDIKIIKIPILNFEFLKDETFESARKNIDSVINICSFYFQKNIYYKKSIIHLKNTRIITYNVLNKSILKRDESFRNFGINWNPIDFMSNNWKRNAFYNYEKLHKVIELYNQSHLVDDRSKLLIRYSIIEICMGGKKEKQEQFTFLGEKKKLFNNVLETFLKEIPKLEHSDFISKWNYVSEKIKTKPMKSPLKEFLISNRIPDNLPITIEKIKNMRDDISHGSIKIDEKKLINSNILLYRITGILILNLLGIDDWKFNLSLPNDIKNTIN